MFESSDSPVDETAPWPSFADVAFSIAIIMLLYVLAQFAASSEKVAVMVEMQRRQNLIQSDIDRVIPARIRKDMTVVVDGNLQKFAFSDRILFKSGSSQLSVSGKHVLKLVGDAIRQHLDLSERIQIEGHTDAVPLRESAEFPSNWELSSARATAVVRYLHNECQIDPSLLSAVGLSEYHPVDPGHTSDARGRNRRIELVFVYSTRIFSY